MDTRDTEQRCREAYLRGMLKELEGQLLLENIPDQPMRVLQAAGIGRLIALQERSAV